MTDPNPGQQTSNAQEPPDWYKNPPEWMKGQSTPTNSSPSTTPPATHSANSDGLLREIQALPEKITNSLREALTPPKPPAGTTPPNQPGSTDSQPSAGKTGESSGSEPPKTPGRPEGKTAGDRFRNWWWNG